MCIRDRVYGVMRGYNGLLNGDLKEMNMRSVSDICLLYTSPYKNLANDLYTLLCEVEAFPLSPSVAGRKGGYVVYLKGSGPIEDLLTYLGAPAAAMELMQVKMYKEVKHDITLSLIHI